jgi:secreted trypsin-like serine protease
MSDSILDQIRQKRHRTAVPPRDDVLLSKPQAPVHPEEPQATHLAETTPIPITSTPPTQSPTGTTLEELKAELAKFPETRRHSAIVLEKDLDQRLTRFCKDRGVTVEVFLEAAWTRAEDDPVLLEQIVTEAKHRYHTRKQAGKIRRLITMLQGQS